MNRWIPIVLATILSLSSQSGNAQEKAQTVLEDKTGVNSQYVIESNTMIFYDRSIPDAIKSRKFYKCIDVFNSGVTANMIDQNGRVKKFRILSMFYDEKQILEIDLRSTNSMTPIDFHLLGYIILDNGTGNSILEVIKPYTGGYDIEIYVKGLRTDLGSITNMLNDTRTAMADPIVHKKDNVGSIPFRRISVINSNTYVKNFQNNSLLKVIDIYRPAELDRAFNNPQVVASQASWFVTAVPVDANKEYSKAQLYYIKNPQIVEGENL